MIDVSQPVPGPYRMPDDGERRCRVYLKQHFQDCVDLCEVHPDIGEHTDATMRLIVASWEMRELLKGMVGIERRNFPSYAVSRAKAILEFIEKG